jgi:uncharacterized protein (DUF2147 family)
MKTKMMLAAATLAAALASPALAADPTGLWQTPTNGGQVRIARCGEALCGTLVTSNHIRADANARDEHNRNADLRNRTAAQSADADRLHRRSDRMAQRLGL